MKRIIFCITLALAALTTSSCLDTIQNDLDALGRRIGNLEERCVKINDQIDALRQLVSNLEEYDFITKVDPIRDGAKITGYRIYFTHSEPITLMNGTDAGTPVLGVAQDSDGVYYWTVLYPGETEAQFVRNNFGEKIPASAASPELKIEDGYWFVTYDGGKSWQNLGKATADDGTSFFIELPVSHQGTLFS